MNLDVKSLILTEEELKEAKSLSRADIYLAPAKREPTKPTFTATEAVPWRLAVTRHQSGKDRWRLTIDAQTGEFILENLLKHTYVKAEQAAQLTPFFRGVTDPIETGCVWLERLYPDIRWRRAIMNLLDYPSMRKAVTKGWRRFGDGALRDSRNPIDMNWPEFMDQYRAYRGNEIARAVEVNVETAEVVDKWQRRHASVRGDVTQAETVWVSAMAPTFDILAANFGSPWTSVWAEEVCHATFDAGYIVEEGIPSITAYNYTHADIWEGTNPATARAVVADLTIAGYDFDHPDPLILGWLVREGVRQGFAESPLRFMSLWAQHLRWQREILGYVAESRPRNIRSELLSMRYNLERAGSEAMAKRAPTVKGRLAALHLGHDVCAHVMADPTAIRRDALGQAAAQKTQSYTYITSYVPIASRIATLKADLVAIDVDGREFRAICPADTCYTEGTLPTMRPVEVKGGPSPKVSYGSPVTAPNSAADPFGLYEATEKGWTRLATKVQASNMVRIGTNTAALDADMAAMDDQERRALTAYGLILQKQQENLHAKSLAPNRPQR